MAKCYYSILGVTTGATVEEIRRSFRLLAFRFHPDRNPRDPMAGQRFREALEAYETLVDPARRSRYDRGRGIRKSGRGKARSGFEGRQDQGAHTSLKDVLEEYFGVKGGEGHPGGASSPDLRFELQVARTTLLRGELHRVEYVREIYCLQCAGRGAVKGRRFCEVCGGKGRAEEPMSVWVSLPPDCRDGARVRLRGFGDRPTHGLPAGDLVVYVEVLEGL